MDTAECHDKYFCVSLWNNLIYYLYCVCVLKFCHSVFYGLTSELWYCYMQQQGHLSANESTCTQKMRRAFTKNRYECVRDTTQSYRILQFVHGSSNDANCNASTHDVYFIKPFFGQCSENDSCSHGYKILGNI